MGRIIKLAAVLSLFFSQGAQFGCGSSSNGTGGSSGITFDLFTTAEEAAPIVTPSASLSVNQGVSKATWSSNNNLYTIFYLIQEYLNSRDSGQIDGSNMHKALYEANTYSQAALGGCIETMETEEHGTVIVADHSITDQSITPPFDLGADLLTQTYNCAYTTTETGTAGGSSINYIKSNAVKYASGIYYMLLGVYSTQGTTISPSIMQVQYNTTTNDITVNNAYLVDYGTGEIYAVRIHVDGNTQTHLFTLRLFKYGVSNGITTKISIAGYGYSEGDNYYLFRVTSSGMGDDVTDSYFCFESSTTEDEMMLMDDAGSQTIPANCANLGSGLPSNYNIDASEVPTSASSFTGGGSSHIELSWRS